ncbi:uncharacterized [Tachysurus ichikawai]
MSGVVVIKQWDRVTAEELNCGRAEAELSRGGCCCVSLIRRITLTAFRKRSTEHGCGAGLWVYSGHGPGLEAWNPAIHPALMCCLKKMLSLESSLLEALVSESAATRHQSPQGEFKLQSK